MADPNWEEQRRRQQEQQAFEREMFHLQQQQAQNQWQQQQAAEWQRYNDQQAREEQRIREQRALEARGRQSERGVQTSNLDAAIARYRAEQAAGEADMRPRFGEIEAERAFTEKGQRRQDVLTRAAFRNNLTGQGLGLSGIREGTESRQTAKLLGDLATTNRNAQYQKDALTRAIDRLRAETAAKTTESESQKRAIQQHAW